MYKYVFFLAVIGVMAFATVTEAATVMRSGEVVSVANDQAVEANFYAWGSVITISGEMGGDVVIAGDTLTINGKVTDDVLAAGRTVSIGGEIGNDIRVAANDIVIDGTITGSVTVVGRQVKILSTATITGDVIIFATDLIHDGTIQGQLLGTIGRARINGPIVGDVSITTNILTVGERAEMGGALTYVSTRDYTRHPDATVAGAVVRNDPVLQTNLGDAWRMLAIGIFMILFGTMTLFIVLRRRVMQFAPSVLALPFWRSALLGFGVLITTPFVISVLLVSVIGAPVGVLVLVLYSALLMVALLLLPVAAGSLLSVAVKQNMQKAFLLWLLIAAVFLIVVLPVPVAGPVLGLTLFLITLGTIVRQVYGWVQRDTVR